MDALDQSDELMRSCEELRARSARVRAATAETREKSRRLLAGAAEAQDAVLHAHGWEPAGRRTSADGLPGGR